MSVMDVFNRVNVDDTFKEVRATRQSQYAEEIRKEEQKREAEQLAAHASHSREAYLNNMQQWASGLSDDELDSTIERLQNDKPKQSAASSGINRLFSALLGGTNAAASDDLWKKAEQNDIQQGAYRSTLSPLLEEKERRTTQQRQSTYNSMSVGQLRSEYDKETDSGLRGEIYDTMGKKAVERLSPRQISVIDEYLTAEGELEAAESGNFLSGLVGETPLNTLNAVARQQQARQKLIGEFGESWADLYVDFYRREKNAEQAQQISDDARELAGKHPVIASAAAAAANLMKPVALKEVINAAAENRPLDENSVYFTGQNYQNSATDEVKKKVDWNIKLPGYGETDVFDFLYDTGMSMVDSIAAGTLMGPAGGAFIGLEAATDTMYDAAQKGTDVKSAVVQGTLAGIFEGLFETVSLSQFKGLQEQGIKKLISKDGVKQMFRNMGVSTLTNASEEASTEIANIIADMAINGGASGYGEAVREYMLDGYSEADARVKAAGDMARQVVSAGAGGALMGGVMGAAGSAIGAGGYNLQQKASDISRGSELVSQGKAEAVATKSDSSKLKDKVLAQAIANREAAQQEDVAKAAGAVIMRDKQKKSRSEKSFIENVGKLDRQLQGRIVENAISKRLSELGETGDVSKISRAIVNTLEGYAQNTDEKAVKNSQYANSVINELTSAAQGRNDYSNEWAYKLSDKLSTIYERTDTSVDTTSEASDEEKNDGGQKAPAAEIKTEAVKALGRAAGTAEADSTDEYTVRTADREYNAEDLAKLPEAQREVVLAAGAYSPEGASVFINNKPKNINTRVYNASFNTMYTAGRLETGYDEAAKKNHYSVERLGEDVARAAYNAGLNEVRAKQRTAAPTGGVRAEGRYESTTEKKSRIDTVYSAIAAKTGLDIQRVEELTDGQRTANGEYITGAARIIMSEGARNETGDVIHELGHFAADFAGEKYRVAAGAIVSYNMSRFGQERIDVEIRDVMKDYGIDYAAAKEEYINECFAGLFSTDDGMQQFIDWLNGDSGYSEKEKKSILQKLREIIEQVIDILKEVLHRENMSDIAKKQAETELEKAKEMRALLLSALDEAGAKVKGTGEAKAETGEREKKNSYFGKRADGIEVFVTSDETKSLTWKERKKRYLNFINNIYKGRTAKFIRNGHTYYAEFDRQSSKKAICGDSRSDVAGLDAVINTGADGDIFELVENSNYTGSSKNKKANTAADYFDYFVKTVQIDDKVFDLLADVEKKYKTSGGYVYTLRLIENKNIEASPIQEGQASLNNSDNASNVSISNSTKNVKKNIYTGQDTENRGSIGSGKSFTEDTGDVSEFSLQPLEDENELLKKENRRLEEIENTLRGQYDSRKEISAAGLEAGAREIYRQVKSSVSIDEITNRLKKIQDDAREKDYSFEDFKAACRDLADELVNTSKRKTAPTRDAQEILKEIRATGIKFSELQKEEAGYAADGRYIDYLRRTFGKISIRKDGVPLETQWHIWHEQFPSWFPASTTEAEMPGRLLNNITALYDSYDNEYGMYAEDDKKFTAAEIMNVFSNADGVNYAIAELREQRLEQVRRISGSDESQTAAFVSAQIHSKASRNEAYIRAKKRKAITSKVKKLNRQFSSGTDTDHIPEEMREAVGKLIAAFTGNNDILSEDAVKILYNAYGVAFEDVENMGDESESGSLTGYSQEIREAIQQLYSIAKKQGELKLAKLTTEELTTVEKVVGNISYIVENQNAVFLDEKQQALEEVGQKHLKDLKEMKKRKYITIGDMQFSPVKDKTVIPNLKPVYFFEMMTTKPMQLTFKDMMLGQNRLAKNSKAAKEYLTQMSEKYEAYKWADTELEPIRTSEGRTLKLTVEQALNIYATAKRERRNIGTPGETRHLKKGGVIFEKQLEGKDKKVRLTSLDTNAYHLDVFDISVIEQALSEQQKEYADSMVQYLSTDMAELGNDTSMKLYGYKKYTEDYYFPFSSDRHYSEQKLGVANDRKLKSSGFTKKLTRQASTPLVLRNFTDVWSSHVEDMCEYNAFAIPLDTLNRIFNYKQRPASFTIMRRDSYMILKEQFGQERAQELSKAAAKIAMNEAAENDPELAIYASSEGVIRKELSGIDKEEAKAVKAAAHEAVLNGKGENISASQLYEDAYGKRAAQWLSTFVKDVNGNVIKDSRESDFGSRLVSNAKKAAVLGNASVTVQQFSAVARALPYVGIKYFAKTTVSGRGNKTWEECQKYCGVAIIKDIGGFDTGTGHSVARWIADGRDDIKGAKKKIRDKAESALSFGAETADKITWCHIWNACKNKAEGKGFTGEEMFFKAAEYFNEVIEHTQVYDSVLSRSDSMRSKSGFMQMLTAFMSEPTVTFNMIVDAMTDVKAHNTKKAAAIGVSLVCNIVLNTMLKNIVKALRDDDEDEAYLEKYISGVIGDLTGEMQIINGHRVYTPMSYLTSEFSIASMLPYIKDIVSILQGYGVDRMDLSAVSDVLSATTNLVKAFESNDSEKLGKAAYSFVLAGSSLTGIPAGNLARYVKAVINATHMRGLLPEADALIKQIQDSTGTGAYDTNRKIKYLYNAYAQKNDKKKATAESFYDDPKKLEADLKKGLREYDGRILTAAEQFVDGNVDEYLKTAREIIDEKAFDEDIIVEAIQAEITQVKKERGITDSEETNADRINALFKAEDYYFAVQDGKTQNAEKIKDEIISTAKANGKTEDEAKQYFRSGLIAAIKKNDERIEKAALAWKNGNFKQYQSLVEQVISENKFDRSFIEKAVKNAVGEYKEGDPYSYSEKEISLYDTDDFVRAAYDGSEDMLTDIKAEITDTEIANGKSEDDAENKFKTDLRASLKEAYWDGDASPELVTRLLGEYDEQTEEDAANTMTVWDIQKEYPDTTLEAGSIKSYVKNELASYGIDIPIYEEYYEKHRRCKGTDNDGDGKADSGTKQAEIIDAIDSLDISNEQKRILFLLDYSAKNCPW